MTREPNHLLRRSRVTRLSPDGSGRPMSRRDLAEAVNAHIFETTGRMTALSAGYVARLEAGAYRWPYAHYRAGFRAVLGAESDAALGFHPGWRGSDEQYLAQLRAGALDIPGTGSAHVGTAEVRPVQVAVGPLAGGNGAMVVQAGPVRLVITGPVELLSAAQVVPVDDAASVHPLLDLARREADSA